MSTSRVEIAKAALSDLTASMQTYNSAISRLKGLALLEGNAKLFALVPKKTTTPNEKPADVGAESSRNDATSSSPSAAAAAGGGGPAACPDPQLFVQRLYRLPTELHHTLAKWIGSEGKEAATLKLSTTMANTSHAGSSAVETAVTAAIDGLINDEHKRLTDIIDYQPLRQSASRRRVSRLIRLRYVLEMGGDWSGSVPLLRLAKNCKRIQQLPLQLNEGDVGRAGSRADIDSRPASMRQYGLIGHRLGLEMTRRAGWEWLGWLWVSMHTRETVPARYRDAFNPADPPCDGSVYRIADGYHVYRSFHELATDRIVAPPATWRIELPARRRVGPPYHPASSAASVRIAELMAQPTRIWGGHTIDRDCNYSNGTNYRIVILCGDHAADDFAAYITMGKEEHGETYIDLFSNEGPQGDGKGVADSPQAAVLARTRMGGDAWLIPQLSEAIPTGGRGESGGRSADDPPAPAQPSSDMGYTVPDAAAAGDVGVGDGVSGGSNEGDMQMGNWELDSVADGAAGGPRGQKRGRSDEEATLQGSPQPHNSKRFAAKRPDK